MGLLSSSGDLAVWRLACAAPRCGNRCFRSGQRKAIIRTLHRLEMGSDYMGLVRLKGLEPTRIAAREPKSRMSTNSITGAYKSGMDVLPLVFHVFRGDASADRCGSLHRMHPTGRSSSPAFGGPSTAAGDMSWIQWRSEQKAFLLPAMLWAIIPRQGRICKEKNQRAVLRPGRRPGIMT